MTREGLEMMTWEGYEPESAHTSFIRAWEDKQLGTLRRHYPAWIIWIIREWPGITLWCACKDWEIAASVKAESPEHLVQQIAGRPKAAGLRRCPIPA